MSGLNTPFPALSQWTASLNRPVPSADPAVRASTASCLFAVGVFHALEIQGQLNGAAWLTAGFCLLAVVAPTAGLWLLTHPSLGAWQFGGVASAAALGGYILTRSVPVPGDPGDVGNWLEPLGLASILTESVILVLATSVLVAAYRTARAPRPGDLAMTRASRTGTEA
jgi:hypothetical protein